MFWIVLLASCGFSTAWICGNEGQCLCTNSGEIMCSGVSAAPVFAVSYRHGKRLTLELNDREFDMETLNSVLGFDSVFVVGLAPNLCVKMEKTYPHTLCVLTRTVEFISTNTPRSAAAAAAESRTEGQTAPSTSKALVTWVVVSTLAGIVIISCILVSLVNLHARINTHARSADPPLFAVDCCLRCMALIMCPIHVCAQLFNCRSNCLYSLERGSTPVTRSFDV